MVVPPVLVTAIGPVLAPEGTVTRMKLRLRTLKLASTPLNVTLVAPIK